MRGGMMLLTGVLALVLWSGAAASYELWECHGHLVRWPGETVTINANPVSFPDGIWRGAVDVAVDRVNDNPSRFSLLSATDPGGVEFRNGQNEIWGTDDVAVLGGDPAATFQYVTCAPLIIPVPPFFIGWLVEITEADIVFDYGGSHDWTPVTSAVVTDLVGYGGDARMIQAAIVHELGHGAGLDDENDEYNVMGHEYEHLHVNNWFARGYLGEDAADGLVELYGLTTFRSFEDLGVVHWAYLGPDGAYSDHRRVRLYDTVGAILPSTTVDYDGDGDDDEVRYRVSRSQRLQVEFTYENNGATRQPAVPVGFYLSTDAFISTADARIGGATLDLGRNDVYTARHSVIMPSTLRSGQDYWIGAIIDETDALTEPREWNNATYIPVIAN